MADNLKTLRIVPLEPKFLPEVLEIEAVNHGAPWSEASFLREIEAPQGLFFVALLDGRVAGYGGGWFVIDEVHIINVSVKSDLQGRGIGRKLMVALLEGAKAAGILCSTLEVRAGNDSALHLYESLGYERVAVRKRYYPDNKEDAVVMWLMHLQDWNSVSRSA